MYGFGLVEKLIVNHKGKPNALPLMVDGLYDQLITWLLLDLHFSKGVTK